MTVKLLIDECLHTSLVEIAHAAGHLADHVNYLGLGSSKDWQLMATIRSQDYTFVTNNRSDFLALHGQEPLHAAHRWAARLPREQVPQPTAGRELSPNGGAKSWPEASYLRLTNGRP